MQLEPIQYLILQVLSVQADGYLCGPATSAFVAEGLEDSEEVTNELITLTEIGLVDFYTEREETTLVKIERDSNGDPVLDTNGAYTAILDEEDKLQTEVISMEVDSGWIITEKGRGVLNEL